MIDEKAAIMHGFTEFHAAIEVFAAHLDQV
jgi:hypothetical protein